MNVQTSPIMVSSRIFILEGKLMEEGGGAAGLFGKAMNFSETWFVI